MGPCISIRIEEITVPGQFIDKHEPDGGIHVQILPVPITVIGIIGVSRDITGNRLDQGLHIFDKTLHVVEGVIREVFVRLLEHKIETETAEKRHVDGSHIVGGKQGHTAELFDTLKEQ